MKRSPFLRHPRVKAPREPRPGITPRMPSRWAKLCVEIIDRDARMCRRCGAHGAGPIDHLVPRRLLVGTETANKANLALLCLACHGYKTSILEPKLYSGNVLAFNLFLLELEKTGPIPSRQLRTRAFKRLREIKYDA